MVRTLQRQQFHFRYILPFHKTTCPSKNYKAALRTGQCKNAAKWNNQLENKTHKSLKQTNKIYSNINKTTPVEKPLQSFLTSNLYHFCVNHVFMFLACIHSFVVLFLKKKYLFWHLPWADINTWKSERRRRSMKAVAFSMITKSIMLVKLCV